MRAWPRGAITVPFWTSESGWGSCRASETPGATCLLSHGECQAVYGILALEALHLAVMVPVEVAEEDATMVKEEEEEGEVVIGETTIIAEIIGDVRCEAKNN